MTAPAAPPRPNRPEPAESRGRGCLPMVLAAVLALGMIALLVLLSQGVLGFPVLVAAGVFVLIVFHYLVWGRWLSRVLRDDPRKTAASNRDAPREPTEEA